MMGVVNQELLVNSGGSLHGTTEFGQVLERFAWDPGILRPYIADEPNNPRRGRPCVTINTGRWRWDDRLKMDVPIRAEVLIRDLQERGINSPVFNSTTLRKYQWVKMDEQVLRAARLRMRAWDDLVKRPGTYSVPGMSKMVLEHETMSDPGEAIQDMDGIAEGRGDHPKFQLEGLPLVITHSSFEYSQRRLLVSKSDGGTGLDSISGETAGRRVGEKIEKTLIGVDTGMSYGGTGRYDTGMAYSRTASVYGYLNFTPRLTKTNLYKPTGVGRSSSGWVPDDTVQDVLAMRDSLFLNKFFGPFIIYTSNDWDAYLDRTYVLQTSGGTSLGGVVTLRERLKMIDGVEDIRRLDFLAASATTFANDAAAITSANPWTMIMVQMTPDVVRAVNGMDITTVQWEEKGGSLLKFRVMAIQVPQLRADFNGYCGLLHANASAGV